MKFYTGIGSRKTPARTCKVMTELAGLLEARGYTLRSGAADGADKAFEAGVVIGNKEIYLPWRGFNGSDSNLYLRDNDISTEKALALAEKYHPAWHACNNVARKLHARNGMQVLGYYLDKPSDFVICWTLGATGIGGTGQALRIARAHNIPIYDLDSVGELKRFMEERIYA